jgi:hypothetical protein
MAEPSRMAPSQGNKEGKHKANANQCAKCGFYKTWGYKILNPTTGKYMPAHVNTQENNAEAEILGDGSCPKYAAPAAPPVTNGQIETPVKVPALPTLPLVPAGSVPKGTAETMFSVDHVKALINVIGDGFRIINENLHAIADYLADIKRAVITNTFAPKQPAELTRESKVGIG